MFGFIKGNQWIGFDTPSSIKRKMNYVKNKKLGGAMIWAIDLDDYLGACGSKWPLLSTMNHELRRKNICICPEQSVKLAVSTLDIVYFIHYLFPALGSELGIEVDNEIIEIAPIPTEDEDESEEEDPSDYNEYNDSNDISDEDEVEDEIDFDCPGSGFYASPTDCEKYYQCTADKTVHI